VNDAIFEALSSRKDEIEASYGGPLVWDRLEGSHGAKIDTERVAIGTRSDPAEEGLIELAEAANRLIAAFKPVAEAAVAQGQEDAAGCYGGPPAD
jgi:hypothetical protein